MGIRDFRLSGKTLALGWHFLVTVRAPRANPDLVPAVSWLDPRRLPGEVAILENPQAIHLYVYMHMNYIVIYVY